MSSCPPPPPLPEVTAPCNTTSVKGERKETESEAVKLILKTWKAICENRSMSFCPEKQIYVHLTPVVQEGPTCGLVALSMVSSVTPKHLPVSELLITARTLGYTIQGEMFSVENMALLIKETLSEWFDVEYFSGGLKKRKEKIIDDLEKTALYLVPYDADKNHSPSCLKGHKAHWAVLCGLIKQCDRYFLLARQGKSRYVGIWSFEELDASNANLKEISPERNKDGRKYVLTDMTQSLAGKYIALYKKLNINNLP